MKQSHGGEVWSATGTSLHPVRGKEILSYCGSVCTCVVEGPHESTKTSSAALAPGLETLRPTVMLVAVCISCPNGTQRQNAQPS